MIFRRCAFLATAIFALLISACSTIKTVEVSSSERERLYLEKSERLSRISAWSLEGRLAVSDEKDGGSGQFSWQENRAGSDMDFHGALGRGAWRLEADGQGAVLFLSDGTIHRAESIDTLVLNHVGWKIPVGSLAWWVRGLASPGNAQGKMLDGDGNLTQLKQDGWNVVYDKYREVDGMALPVKLTAVRKSWKVKLVVRDWEISGMGATDE